MISQEYKVVHRSRFVDATLGHITALSFSHKSTSKITPGDLRLALGRSNGNIEIWNPRDNWYQELVIQGGKERSIEGLCWCELPNEPLRLFSIGGSTSVTEWDLSTGLPLLNYDCNSGVIWSIAINESNNKLSVGCDNGSVVLIDISGGRGALEHEAILTRQDFRVLTLAWSHDNAVIGGCSDGRIRVWATSKDDRNGGGLIHTMKVDKSKKESTLVWSVLYLPHLNQIVSGDSTGSVKFWDFHYGTLTQSFKVHNADVLCLTTDIKNSKVFSAGVDRKIFQFNNIQSGKVLRWVNASNRLFHSNDIRSMCSYQSKGSDFLISGGVEKTLVVSSLNSFSDGNYRKLPLFPQFQKNILINREQRLLVMWQDTTIKIWMIGSEIESQKNYKLVLKLVLKDEQNISTCALSPDGQVLLVGRPSLTKIFYLQQESTKFKVTKLDNDFLLETGCKYARFINNSTIVLCTNQDNIFKLDLESDDKNPQTLNLSSPQETKISLKLPHINAINHLITYSDQYVIISRVCGAIELIDLQINASRPLIRLAAYITAIHSLLDNTIMLVTAENKIYELNLSNDENFFTPWCKRNAENLPLQFLNLKDKCVGIFSDELNQNKIWFWGPTWLVSIDKSIDFPVNKRKPPKKRRHDSLTITDDIHPINDGDEEDEDEEASDVFDDFIMKPHNEKSSESLKNKKDEKPFFLTDKYRPIIFADNISPQELVIVERPAFLIPQSSAYDLPKLKF